ncbi:GNAT family N-acetyltransferase [Bacillus niameyensis]|uniref:GNAT family N-acetyltransferase n=1 Tax=Bacillus niameyensis TaxID=1522308 RepID=UPI000785BC28|nr:GNAT family N-acetyltransferase [Bacillus niameyensis]
MNRLSGTLPLNQWFRYVQESPYYWAWLVYEGEVPIGQIDMEMYTDFSASISLLTNPRLRNKGFGKKMLNTLLQRPEMVRVQKLVVYVEIDNLASLACFKHVGFIENGIDEDGLQILTLEL